MYIIFFFFLRNLYVFLASLGLRCRCLQAFLELRQARVYSLVVVHGFLMVASLVDVHGLSCFAACGIFLDQASNLCPKQQQVDSQALDHQGSPTLILKNEKT